MEDAHESQGETGLQRPVRSRRAALLGAAGLLIVTALAYAPVWNAGFVWDDDANVIDNLPLRDADGLRRLWLEPGATTQYYPLVYTSLWLEYALVELEPRLYHVDNVLLHAASALIFWRLLLLFGLGASAWWAAAVFALHPVHVESVAWVTERKNVLSGLFYLASAFVYLRSACDVFREPTPRERRLAFGASLLLFVCALFSKSPTASLPAAILVVVWWRRGRLAWADVRPLVPFVVLGAPIALLTASMEDFVGEVLGFEWSPSPAETLLLAGRATWFYLGKLLLPWPLVFVYPRWEIDAGSVAQWLFPIAAIAMLAAFTLARDRIGRAPLATALFFGGTLVPVLGFFEIYYFHFSFVADHWQYLASLGPIALVAGGGLQRLAETPRRVVGTIVLAVLGLLTFDHARDFHDSETLWRSSLAHNDEAPMVHYNLGLLLQGDGRTEEAAQHYRRAIELRPDYAIALNNLAEIRAGQGRIVEAVDLLEEAVAAAPDDSTLRWNYGRRLEQTGRFDAAVPHYLRAIELAVAAGQSPQTIRRSRLYVANALVRNGMPALGLEVADAAARDHADRAPVHVARGRALLRLGRRDEAIAAFRTALGIDPRNRAARQGLEAAQGMTPSR